MKHKLNVILLLSAMLGCTVTALAASDADWQAMARYEYGQDVKPLLAIDREMIAVINGPEKRKAFVAHLASSLADPKTALSAKQFICQKLQTVGTPDQVPLLAKMLDDAATAEMARMALEQIPGEESLDVLRAGLKKYQGRLLVGLINSLAMRRDAASIPTLKTLADDKNAEVADAAIWALGRMGGSHAAEILTEKAAQASAPLPQRLAVPYLRCAARLLAEGKTDAAIAIYRRMSKPGESPSSREAALYGLLISAGDKQIETILDWLCENDPLKRQIAAGQLNDIKLDTAAVQTLLDKLSAMPVSGKILLFEALAAKREKAALPAVMAAAKSDDPALKLAAVRCLGTIGDAAGVSLLIEELTGEPQFAQSAEESLAALPGAAVDQAVLAAMKNSEESTRGRLIEILSRRKSTLAVSSLLAEAGSEDAAVHLPAIAALRSLAAPHDAPAMIGLLTKTEKGKHRDEIEKTILLVCKKTGADTSPAAAVLAAYAKADETARCTLLPLQDRLGGKESLEIVSSAIKSDNPKIQTAAVRALCNWPDVTVADRLLELAKTSPDKSHRTWALRAYIRVISLKSERPESQTLAMLQNAMKLADADAQRRLVIQRAAAVRTMDTLRWVAPYLDDPELSQEACRTVVELAHHRFLRNPNKAEFATALKKVTEIAKDPKMVERAKRYMLGL